jgi:hypothetical protein
MEYQRREEGENEQPAEASPTTVTPIGKDGGERELAPTQ